MPKIDIGAADIATGCTDDSRCRERAVARLAPQEAGVARHQTADGLIFAVKTCGRSKR
jgi:hypothetical protein